MEYRLGLDLGTNSLGWAILRLDDKGRVCGLLDAGVRIFRDGRKPKSGTSLASERRLARQQRRRRDRYLHRRSSLLSALIRHGLMPATEADRKALESLDPFELRARGLDQALTPHEFGRALFHLSQRRGFRSSRKATAADEEEGVIRSSIAATREAMGEVGARTMGEFLQKRRIEGLPVRARYLGKSEGYALYFDRQMTEEEFDQLWDAQQAFNPALLNEQAREETRDIILFQRPLRPVVPGRCLFEPDELRAPLALPTTQRFRIYQELANLRVIDPALEERPLTLQERDAVAELMERQAKVTFPRMRKLLGLPRGSQFNFEETERKFLLGNVTSTALGSDDVLGDDWHAFSEATQDRLVATLCGATSDDELMTILRERFGLTEYAAVRACEVTLPEGYGRLSLKALARILTELRSDVITYDKAAARAGYDHSDFYDGVLHDRLPYYGEVLERHIVPGSGEIEAGDEQRFGRVANPTVHIGLNQVRKVVNALIDRYGRPAQIVVELARDLKMSAAQKARLAKEQRQNEARNEYYADILRELGLVANYDNRLRLRLWEELNPSDPLDRRCPFSGTQISRARLFSAEIEVEHILPFARSLDDSPANKTLCTLAANRDKGNRSPFEAFGHSPPGYKWDEIAERAREFPANKAWRFAPDAMERLAGENQDFLARHLVDTAYLSRLAREYLTAVCPKDSVYVIPGRLTALLRHHWGLNSLLSPDPVKDRTDQRHHTIDAVVVGCTDRATLQKVSRAAGQGHTDRLIERIAEPWPDFRIGCSDRLRRVVVSYKPEHGIEGALHNATAYGIADLGEGDGPSHVVYRRPLNALKPTDIPKIRDPHTREALAKLIAGHSGKEFSAALAQFLSDTGTRRIRLTEPLSVVVVAGADGGPYKAYKTDSNYCMEIVEMDSGRWHGELISTFEANQQPYRAFIADAPRSRKRSFSDKPLVMRLRRDDMIAIGIGPSREIMRVQQLSTGKVVMAAHRETNVDARNREKADPFSYTTKSPDALRKLGARKVFVDPIGRVKDPMRHAPDDS